MSRQAVIGELEDYFHYQAHSCGTIVIDTEDFKRTCGLSLIITVPNYELLRRALNLIRNNWALKCYCMRPKGTCTYTCEDGRSLTTYYYRFQPFTLKCTNEFASNELTHLRIRLKWWTPFTVLWRNWSDENDEMDIDEPFPWPE